MSSYRQQSEYPLVKARPLVDRPADIVPLARGHLLRKKRHAIMRARKRIARRACECPTCVMFAFADDARRALEFTR